MTKEMFDTIEAHMIDMMKDSAHDRMHVYRVLYEALDIVRFEENVDVDVLIAACLLHDIGREQQAQDLELDHASIGADMAHEFLRGIGWDECKAAHVHECVKSHRYRKGEPPESIEAKIVFDADKLDVTGAIGIARTLTYGGQVTEPLYLLDEEGKIKTEGGGAEISSFFQEFNYKLRKVYTCFFTQRAQAIAAKRKRAMMSFYDSLYDEVQESHDVGTGTLEKVLE